MESTIIVLKQVISMCLMAAISYILVEKNKISPQATKSFSGILLYVVTPCVILSSMQRPFIAEEAWGLGAALLLSLVLQLIFIGLAHLIIPKKNNLNIGVERFAMVMSNTGYIGIPMAQAVLGPDGVFFISANIIVFNLILFSYARLQLLRDGIRHGKLAEVDLSLRKQIRHCLINPASISAAVGFILYFLQISLPSVLMTVVDSFYSINTALSMIVVGILLAQTELKPIFLNTRLLRITFCRNILCPLVAVLLLAVLDLSPFFVFFQVLKSALVIGMAAPCAVATAFMADLFGADGFYGSQLVANSTIYCVVTMPLLYFIWQSVSALF